MKLGPRHLQQLGSWIPTLAMFGGGAGLAFIYIAEWKDALQYLPYYNGKYPKTPQE